MEENMKKSEIPSEAGSPYTELSNKEVDDKDSKSISGLEWLQTQFEKNIPLDDVINLPDVRWKIALGVFSMAIVIAIFIYFLVTTYQSSLNSPFVSLESSAGKCKSVPKGITETHLATTDGNWDGSVGFDYSKALYKFGFQNFIGDDSLFKSVVQKAESVLATGTTYADNMANQSLAMNIIYLMTAYLHVNSAGNYQLLQFTANPGIVYHGPLSYATITPADNDCTYVTSMKVDKSTAVASMEISVDATNTSANCNLTDFYGTLGYNSFYHHGSFDLDIDLNPFVVCVAVNYGFMNTSDLEELTSAPYPEIITFDDVEYTLRLFVYFKIPNMDPLFCIFRGTHFLMCLMTLEYTLAFPVTNSWGAEFDVTPARCDCETGVGNSYYCNRFFFLNGLFIPRSLDSQGTFLSNMINFALAFEDYYGEYWYYAAAVTAYELSFYSAKAASGLSQYIELYCGYDCVMITLATANSANFMSEYGFQLENGGCSYEIFSDTSWSNLYSPPIALTETYYSCVYTEGIAFFNAVGISVGNAQLAIQLFGMFVLPLFFAAAMHFRFGPRQPEYSKESCDDVLEKLAHHLLRVRQGKIPHEKVSPAVRELLSILSSSESGNDHHSDSAAGIELQFGADKDSSTQIELVSPVATQTQPAVSSEPEFFAAVTFSTGPAAATSSSPEDERTREHHETVPSTSTRHSRLRKYDSKAEEIDC